MSKIKELIVFSNGDSGKISTWSNIPFFFTETLLAKGITVHRVDIAQSEEKAVEFQNKWNRYIRRLFPNTSYEYFRSKAHYNDVRRRIKEALLLYPNADAHLFLTFSFSSEGLSNKPVALFGDWTYDHFITHFRNQKPDFLEKKCLKRENKLIEKANLILPLFPAVAEYMKSRYKNPNIKYLGNVINSLIDVPETEVLNLKKNSNKLLFVGSKEYLEGANSLLKAFSILKKDHPNMTLEIIGMDASKFDQLPKGVTCHGYLDKGKTEERELYYKLLKEAKLIINTTPKWAAFSSTIEAMYFYTPVLVSPYDEFLKTFGEELSFGSYCAENAPSLIAQKTSEILRSNEYHSMCLNAHQAVEGFTWGAYVDRVVREIELLS